MPSITDPRHAPSNPLDALFARLIRDVRDVSLARVSVLLVPAGLLLVALNHHLRSSIHWTELPEKFEAIRDQVVEQDAIVFHKIDYFMIWVLLMLRRTLARFMVQFGEPRTIEERVALLKHRLQPIHVTAA